MYSPRILIITTDGDHYTVTAELLPETNPVNWCIRSGVLNYGASGTTPMEAALGAAKRSGLDVWCVRELLTSKSDEEQEFADEVYRIAQLLVKKNAAYGNSALDPVRIFSKADPLEQIRVRIDDKLSRIARGHDVPGEDTLDDLQGYLFLHRIALNKKAGK